jgi:hypothetical protein
MRTATPGVKERETQPTEIPVSTLEIDVVDGTTGL